MLNIHHGFQKMQLKIIPSKDKFLDSELKKAMKELNNFFDINWIRNTPIIVSVQDRKSIDLFKGMKTESWVVGWAGWNKIFLLDRKNYEKESNHKYSKKEYVGLLRHEICHLFLGNYVKRGYCPKWFNEGICGYASGQIKLRPKPKQFQKFLSQYDEWDGKAYFESYNSIDVLINKYGKIKLIKLLKSLQELKNKTQFDKKFKQIYGFAPNYKKFNELFLREVIKTSRKRVI